MITTTGLRPAFALRRLLAVVAMFALLASPVRAEDILRLAPETKHVVVILGATPLERFWAPWYRGGFQAVAPGVRAN